MDKQLEAKAAETGSGFNKPSSSKAESVRGVLLSRANTMLKAATLSRGGTAQIQDTVKSLQREKTQLNAKMKTNTKQTPSVDEEEIDDDMKAYLNKIHQEKLEKMEFRDSDFDTDLEENSSLNMPMESPSKLYKKTCKKLGIKTVPYVEEQIESKEVKVVNRSLNALDILSLTNALIANQKVTQLILDGNNIGDDGAQVLAWLMKGQESFIEKLSIADNNIKEEGFQAIGEMLTTNRLVAHVNLAGNHAGDESIKSLCKSLTQNFRVQYLNLSFNGIGDKGSKYLAAAIAQNESIVNLDLSWNKIRPTGGVAICSALQENIILKTLNLSMNGLSVPGSMYIGDALKKNESLTYLDVTFNRIFDEGAAHIAKGLEKNEKLHHLIMHNNPLTSAGAMTLLSSIRANENTGMWKLDLSSVPIIKDVCTAYEEYHTKNDGFKFLHGIVLDSDEPLQGDMSGMSSKNPMAMVKDYIEEEGLRLMDFFKLMDKDHGGSISREEFTEGLHQVNVPMSQSQIDTLIDMLDKDGDGEIDYQELVEGEREYRRKKLKQKIQAMEAIKLAMKNREKEESWLKKT